MPTAFIQRDENGRLEPEHAQVQEVLESHGFSIELFDLHIPNSLPLNCRRSMIVIGDYNAMAMAFQQLDLKIPFLSCYPESVRLFLRRRIMQTTVKDLRKTFRNRTGCFGLSQPLFVKPKDDTKLFTGFVVTDETDLSKLQGAPNRIKLYASNVVSWQSEYRVFVTRGQIVGVRHYSGDVSKTLNMTVVRECVELLENNPNESTSAYGIDFGVLNNGETAMVEWNDGYALGSYGLEPEIYTSLLLARWQEIIGTSNEKGE